MQHHWLVGFVAVFLLLGIVPPGSVQPASATTVPLGAKIMTTHLGGPGPGPDKCPYTHGIAFDGHDLWFSCVSSSDTGFDLARADPLTGAVLARYNVANGIGAIASDIEHCGIWVAWSSRPGAGDMPVGDVWFIPWVVDHGVCSPIIQNPPTPSRKFNVASAFSSGDDTRWADGLAFESVRDTLLISPEISTIYRYNIDGTPYGPQPEIPSHTPSPCGHPQANHVSGVALGARLLFEARPECAHVFVTDVDTHQLEFEFDTGGTRPEGMTCDPVTFDAAGAGQHVVWGIDSAWGTAYAFNVPRNTCGFGGDPVRVVPECGQDIGVGWDYGDAPDNTHQPTMRSLYSDGGAQSGGFPSLESTQHSLHGTPGARHRGLSLAWLGDTRAYPQSNVQNVLNPLGDPTPSWELDADSSVDRDGTPNLGPDRDGWDHGLEAASAYANSGGSLRFRVSTSILGGITNWHVNALVDWNFDGQWMGSASNGAPEWAVQNVRVSLPALSSHVFNSPFFQVGPTLGSPWVRLTLTPDPILPGDFPDGWDGSVPPNSLDRQRAIAFACGETEDSCGTLRVTTASRGPAADSVDAIEVINCGRERPDFGDCSLGATPFAEMRNIRAGLVSASAMLSQVDFSTGLGFENTAITANGGLDVIVDHNCVQSFVLTATKNLAPPLTQQAYSWSSGIVHTPCLGQSEAFTVPGLDAGEYRFQLEWTSCAPQRGTPQEVQVIVWGFVNPCPPPFPPC